MAFDSINVVYPDFGPARSRKKADGARESAGATAAFPAAQSKPEPEAVSDSRELVVMTRNATVIANLECQVRVLNKIIEIVKKESDNSSGGIQKLYEHQEVLGMCIQQLKE